MLQKVATVLYFAVHTVAFCCAALVVFSADSASTRAVATAIVVFYTLSSAGSKLAGLYIYRPRTSDRRGILDL